MTVRALAACACTLANTCAGKPDALLASVRYVETHGATMVHAAWDLLLERRPAKAPAERSHPEPESRLQTQSPSDQTAQLRAAERACQQAARMLQGLKLPANPGATCSTVPPAPRPGALGSGGKSAQGCSAGDGAGTAARAQAARTVDAEGALPSPPSSPASATASSAAESAFTELSMTSISSGVPPNDLVWTAALL